MLDPHTEDFFLERLAPGEKPIVLGKPYRYRSPFRVFPLSFSEDWPQILSKIPEGQSLKVPMSKKAVQGAISHLERKGEIRRFQFAIRQTDDGGCIVNHVSWFAGDPFPLEPPPAPHRVPEEFWDNVFKSVLSGEAVTVVEPITAARLAYHARINHGKLSKKSIRIVPSMQGGRLVTRLEPKMTWDQLFTVAATGVPVTVRGSLKTVYGAYFRQRQRGKLPRRFFRFQQIVRDGVQYVRLRKR